MIRLRDGGKRRVKSIIFTFGILILLLVGNNFRLLLETGKILQNEEDAYERSMMVPVANTITINVTVTPMPVPPRIYFVHVGKAGGKTMYKIFHIFSKKGALKCRMKNSDTIKDYQQLDDICYKPKKDESVLSKNIMIWLHLDRFLDNGNRWGLDHTNIFLFSVRDPIDRLLSAFNFHRHQLKVGWRPNKWNKYFYQECFPETDRNAFVVGLRYQGENKTLKDCKIFASNVLAGGSRKSHSVGPHFRWNYGYYANSTIGQRPNHSVAVVRTEHLWEDTIHLDKLVGGSGNFSFEGYKFSHGSEKWKENSILSPANAQYLCCQIYEEMIVYQDLILKSFNLNQHQKLETMRNTLKRCQIEEIDTLPFHWNRYYEDTCKGILAIE